MFKKKKNFAKHFEMCVCVCVKSDWFPPPPLGHISFVFFFLHSSCFFFFFTKLYFVWLTVIVLPTIPAPIIAWIEWWSSRNQTGAFSITWLYIFCTILEFVLLLQMTKDMLICQITCKLAISTNLRFYKLVQYWYLKNADM